MYGVLVWGWALAICMHYPTYALQTAGASVDVNPILFMMYNC